MAVTISADAQKLHDAIKAIDHDKAFREGVAAFAVACKDKAEVVTKTKEIFFKSPYGWI
jgi:hypothetical protein